MDIKQYYYNKANISLNGSLVALIPVAIIIICSLFYSVRLPLLILVLPFCVYSFICYQAFLMHRKRGNEVDLTKFQTCSSLLDNNNYLIEFMPAPSLRMLLFDSCGFVVGEVKDARFWWWRWFLPYFIDRLLPNIFVLYDRNNHAVAYFELSKTNGIEIYDGDRKKIGIYRHKQETTLSMKRNGMIYSIVNKQSYTVEGSAMYPDIKLRNEQGIIIGKLIKGWMPKEWDKHFRNGNTPILTLNHEIGEMDKLLIIGILTGVFQYTSH